MELGGRVAHVTGAAAGIGRTIAVRLAEEGAKVAVSDVDEAGGRQTVERIRAASGTAAFVPADVTDERAVERMLAFTEATLGGLDVVVNNAGGAPEPYFPDAPAEHWRKTIEVNLIGVMLGTHHAVAALRRLGRGGAIVNIASVAGLGLRPYTSPEYGAAKAGVVRLTAALGSLAGEDIRVNCICPDWVETEAIRAAREAAGEGWTGPERLVATEAIADVCIHLLRDESLAGRVAHCPHDGEWGLFRTDEAWELEPWPGPGTT